MTDTIVPEMATTERQTDPVLTGDVLAHLESQLESAHRMLAVVLEQAAAIRERAVLEVVRLATSLQAEMHRREVIELARLDLLERASLKLGVGPADISIRMLAVLMDEDSAQLARDRTTQLRELLKKIQREHTTNRALMQQELSFLDHLLRLAGSAGGYANTGHQSTGRRGAPLHRPVFDLEA